VDWHRRIDGDGSKPTSMAAIEIDIGE